MSLRAVLDAGGASLAEVRRQVDGLSPEQRRVECLALGPAQQRRLWKLAAADEARPLDRLVPRGSAVFAGRNSLAIFSRFEKWFTHHEGGIVGCNRHPLSPLIGPGYFTVQASLDGRLEFDYHSVPRSAPSGWPLVKANTNWPGRVVYGGLIDRVAWVSDDVLVGAAFRDGVAFDSYFVLVRES